MVAFLFALAWAVVFGHQAWRESKAASAARGQAEQEAATAKKAQAALLLEKSNEVYARQQDWANAIVRLDKVLQLDPDLAAAYESRGRVHLGRGLAYADPADIDKAIADFEAALKRPNPDSKVRANTLAALAAARQDKGDTAGALTDYAAAIAAAPDEAQLYLSRGALRNNLGQRQDALADYSKAIELRPGFGDAYLARGQLYADQKDREKAVKDLRMALQYASDDASRTLAKKRLSELGATSAAAPASLARIYLQIVDPKDMNAALAVKRALEEQGYRVARIEPLPGRRTNGDVRYSTAADQGTAERVARSVETVLARQGYQVTMRTFELDLEKFPNAKPGILEVWIPPLSREMLQVPAKLY